MIIQPSKAANPAAEKPVGMRNDHNSVSKIRPKFLYLPAEKVLQPNEIALTQESNMLSMLVFHEAVLTALILGSFKYHCLLNCHKINAPWICKNTAFLKKKKKAVLSGLPLGIYTAFRYLQFRYRYGSTV